jgi:polysaccharide biosynthesis/export protein
MRKLYLLLLIAVSVVCFSSCITRKQLQYFQNLKADLDTTHSAINDSFINSITIKPYDLLDIKITTTEKALEALTQSQTSGSTIISSSTGLSTYISSFIVDYKGNITLPLVGDVQVKGLTIKMAKQKIREVMKNYLKDPYIDIKFLTFKVTVLGEVYHPGPITVSNEKANLIDVLATAGDMTDVGNRRTIKIIRGDPRNPTVYMVDMTNTKSFNSPGFILQPDDIVYVEPLNRKYLLANINLILPYLSIASTIVLLLNVIALFKR